ncbi:MAG: two-component system response regulator [Candidatus Latescibacteria bacterium 4484_7]|nr:MAG: two-component system response regulator [Candidatus Latescibacteria bacterium 4484_7]
MEKLVVVVDDERDILELVELHLKRSGFNVKGVTTGAELMRFLSGTLPELIILDLMLPDADGFELCKQLKGDERFARVPVIMLTARGEETDRVLGLELGADDYVTKPFSPRELVARVKAVLRRSGGRKEEGKEGGKKIRIGKALFIDPSKFEVIANGRKVELTPTEFRILHLLAGKEGWVFSRSQIMNHLWGDEKIVTDRTIDVHIRHIREKLGKAAVLIKNIHGIGYKIER